MLFADDSIQADPPDSEPVFALTGPQPDCDDDYTQPDAPDSFGA